VTQQSSAVILSQQMCHIQRHGVVQHHFRCRNLTTTINNLTNILMTISSDWKPHRIKTRGQSNLANAAPKDPMHTACLAEFGLVTDRLTDRQTDRHRAVTIVCILCIRYRLKIQHVCEHQTELFSPIQYVCIKKQRMLTDMY